MSFKIFIDLITVNLTVILIGLGTLIFHGPKDPTRTVSLILPNLVIHILNILHLLNYHKNHL